MIVFLSCREKRGKNTNARRFISKELHEIATQNGFKVALVDSDGKVIKNNFVKGDIQGEFKNCNWR